MGLWRANITRLISFPFVKDKNKKSLIKEREAMCIASPRIPGRPFIRHGGLTNKLGRLGLSGTVAFQGSVQMGFWVCVPRMGRCSGSAWRDTASGTQSEGHTLPVREPGLWQAIFLLFEKIPCDSLSIALTLENWNLFIYFLISKYSIYIVFKGAVLLWTVSCSFPEYVFQFP